MNIIQENKNKSSLININILHVGLTRRWGSEERFIIKDCLLAKERGAKVYLYTYENSRLSERAKELGIDLFFYVGKLPLKIHEWRRLRRFDHLISQLKIDIVHCYDINLMWPLCFFLRRRTLIPLILTLTTEMKKYYRHLWYRPLSSRVDQIFLPISELVENVGQHLGLPVRKVTSVGMGLSERAFSEKGQPFRSHEDYWCIGTNLNGIETNTLFLDTVFHSFRIMTETPLGGKNYRFILCNERSWKDCHITDEIRRQVKDWGLEEYIIFVDSSDIADSQNSLDLWLALHRREEVEDYVVQALISSVPVVFPRTSCGMELLRVYGKIGETYRIGDSREIREKCESILRDRESYRKNLLKSQKFLLESFGEDLYSRELEKNYINLLGRRKRLQGLRRRKRKFWKR